MPTGRRNLSGGPLGSSKGLDYLQHSLLGQQGALPAQQAPAANALGRNRDPTTPSVTNTAVNAFFMLVLLSKELKKLETNLFQDTLMRCFRL
jgi:hypothetical protein